MVRIGTGEFGHPNDREIVGKPLLALIRERIRRRGAVSLRWRLLDRLLKGAGDSHATETQLPGDLPLALAPLGE